MSNYKPFALHEAELAAAEFQTTRDRRYVATIRDLTIERDRWIACVHKLEAHLAAASHAIYAAHAKDREAEAVGTQPSVVAYAVSGLSFDAYQMQSRATAIYPDARQEQAVRFQVTPGLAYVALGVANKAGKVAGKIKKCMRDAAGDVDDGARQAIGKEAGEVLWYLAQLATELGLDLSEIAQANLDKFTSRKDRGVLGGSGDDR